MSTPPESSPTLIDICICTYRRPYLEQTLRSLAALDLPDGLAVGVIVADNDIRPSARELVLALSRELPFELKYIHCPASNISLARNACLDAAGGDFLAFVDDDSTVSPQWLAELVETARNTGADAVLGPVRAVYSASAPVWMRRGDFHSTEPVWVNGEIRTGYSGNVLLRRASPHVQGRRFDLALGRTGGEDTDYFSQLHRSGGKIAYARDAVVDEPVTTERACFSWLAKRRFRSGQTHGRLLAQKHLRLTQAGLAAAKALFSFGVALVFAPAPHRRNRQALRGLMHVGVVSTLLGLREIRLYGDKPTKEQSHAT
ncbi:succinoglycan biosynthesis protein ExoM [Pseudaminobacter salicylatoxidans]|uniref:Succinoglycan biosynthesis protein ExoM n=1 Tax=Pseudaminobacter salicylatoxidans TaxID=93369 RepID=A0A316C1Q5_PSESE|nr:glycosyltransferase family 2 protein [Pseudaminobacter salicylatoxidans]PWJ82383.1 succinoglycan biosynthesis protein ExoM [Pseudaminobacter salicylatoxidans]